MGSPACASAIQEVIEAVEFGVKPYPIFFTDVDCQKGQWPPQGETLPEHLIGVPFDLRAQACTTNGRGSSPAYLVGTGNNGFPDLSVANCPLPTIQKMFLPTIYTYKFVAPNSTTFALIQNPGAVSIDGLNSTFIQQNIWVVDPSPMSSYEGIYWGSSIVGPFASKDCGYVASDAPFGPFFDKRTSLPTRTLNSCGMPFWPSLSGIDISLTTFVKNDGLNYWTNTNQACFNNNKKSSPGGVAANEVLGGNEFITHCVDSSDVGYTFQDCLPQAQLAQILLTNNGNPSSFLGPMCACTQTTTSSGPGNDNCITCTGGVYQCESSGPPRINTCNCRDNLRLAGSIDTVQIVPSNASPWEFQQFEYCVGLQTLSIGGINIQRYGNGTIACDPIVTTLCQNTAFLASNSKYNKACSCVLEQQRFNIQFAGLDLPVKCFGNSCSNDDPHVYRPSNQSYGCSARLCSQIITINGSAISAEGYQVMLCDGQEYVVTNTDTSPGNVPIVTGGSPSNIELGATFYIALGLLGVMVVLLVAWGIRKWIMTKRSQAEQKKQVLQSVENLIANK